MGFSILALSSAYAQVIEPPAVTQVRHMNVQFQQKDPFTHWLAVNYKSFALYEQDVMGDLKDSNLFSQKAIAAYQGINVPPENPLNWQIPNQFQLELNDAYQRLTQALTKGGVQREPKYTAEAQAKFDCWVEQQEEGWQWDHIDACRGRFLSAMNELEARLSKPVANKQPQQTTQKQLSTTQPSSLPTPPPYNAPTQSSPMVIHIHCGGEGGCPVSNADDSKKKRNNITLRPDEWETGGEPIPLDISLPIEIYFDFDKATVKSEFDQKLKMVAQEMKAKPKLKIKVIGHTDTSGARIYNYDLSKRRANAVIGKLLQYGANPNQLRIIARGENDLKVATKDGEKNPQNRRVQVDQSF